MSRDKVRWGLLSTARIHERLIPCLRASPRSEVVAVASRHLDRAQAFAREWGIPRAHGSYAALLRDPEVDAIYLALPNSLHTEWTVRAAEAGKHVLCEKPLALTADAVGQMAAAAWRGGVVVQEAAMMRFHAQTRFVRRQVAQGVIGDVRLLRGVFTFTLEREADIRWDPALGGGSLWDLGSYCVSFARAVLAAEPVEVFALQTERRGVDASLSAQMRFEGGALVHFFSSFAAFAHIEADLLGTQGRLSLDMPWVNHVGQPATVRWERQAEQGARSTFGDNLDGRESDSRTFEATNAYQDEVNSMVASILDGAPPIISLSDSSANAAVINALLESARHNRPVRPRYAAPFAP